MKILNDQGSIDRLITALTTGSSFKEKNLQIPGIQRTSITEDVLDKVYGSSQNFMQQYSFFEDDFFETISDRKNLKLGMQQSTLDIELMRKQGKIDLNMLNYAQKHRLSDVYRERVLKLDQLLSEVGLPSMQFDSTNMYRSLLKFNVNMGKSGDEINPIAVLLNRTFFNIDPTRTGLDIFPVSGNILTSSRLKDASTLSKVAQGSSVLSLDIETTGPTSGSAIRQIALRQTVEGSSSVEEFNYLFKTDHMNISKMVNPLTGNSEIMTDVLIGLEQNVSPNSILARADETGVSILESYKDVMRKMLSVNHIEIQNSNFDLNMLAEGVQNQPAYTADKEAKMLLGQVFDRVENERGYLIDTAEEARIYLSRKAQIYGQGLDGLDQGNALLRAMIAPEMAAKTAMGGSTTIASVENIILSTNLLELIEQKDPTGAANLIEKIGGGSATHTGGVDTTLQGYIRKFITSEELDFIFPTPGSPNPPPPKSDFVRLLRGVAAKSSAVSPTTNIASVTQISQQTLNFLSSTEKGQQMVTVRAVGSDLGFTNELADTEGFLKYSGSKFKFFADSASEGVDVSNEATARNLISRTLQDAQNQTNMVDLKIGSKVIQRNLSDDYIKSLGISFLQETQINQRRLAQTAVAGISAANITEAETVQFLGLTNQTFGARETILSRVGRIASYFGVKPPVSIRSSAEFGDDVITDYHQMAARGGLGFSSLDTRARSMSVSLSQVTASVAEERFGASKIIGEQVMQEVSHAQRASLLSEMGLSYFKAGSYTRLLSNQLDDLSYQAASKIQAPFKSMQAMTITHNGELMNLFDLSNNAFKNSELNQFTLSFLSTTETVDTEAKPLVNVIWGANNVLSEAQSVELAEQLMSLGNENADLLRVIAQQNVEMQAMINDVNAVKNLTGDARVTTTSKIAESIRKGGIAIASAPQGDVSQDIADMFKRYGVDLVENDIRVKDLVMRLLHTNDDTGLLTFSALSDKGVDLVDGRTSEIAQQEAEEALRRQRLISEALESNPKLRREAEDVVRKAAGRTKTGDLISGGLANFYKKNKVTIGLVALGTVAAGIGYAAAKDNRKTTLYEETLKAQPTEPRRSSNPDLLYDQEMNSTRRDPLVTAGVVGNLDRSKIGHHKMGSGKYDHLYGG